MPYTGLRREANGWTKICSTESTMNIRLQDPKTFEFLDMNDPDVKIPGFQLGQGCLVDQLVGQYMAHLCGLGYLGDKKNIQNNYEEYHEI